MRLIADRFIELDAGTVLDLATGERLLLKRLPSVSRAEAAAWASAACAAASRVITTRDGRSPRIVDFGLIGADERFEAWTMRPQPSSLPERAQNGSLEPAAAAALADAIEDLHGPRPRAIAVFARDVASAAALVIDAARYARRVGFVPLATHLVSRSVRGADGRLVPIVDVLGGRSLLLIHLRGGAGAALAAAVVASARGHLLVCAGDRYVAGVDAIRLPDQRARTVVPRRVARAAEQSPLYVVNTEAVMPEIGAAAIEPPSIVSADVGAWRQRAADAQRTLERGRHAAGERLLRHAIGGLARRRDWAAAGASLTVLARTLLKRGRPGDALVELGRARDLLGQVGDEPGLIDAAILAGRARLQLAKLDEAESTFSGALTASTTSGDDVRACRAGAALANVLLWQGRYDEARDLADRADASIASATAVGTVRVVASIGSGRFREAVSTATAIAASMSDAARPAAVARAIALRGFAHLAVGDLEPVGRELDQAARAAAATGDRLLVIRCRLLAAEAARRRNQRERAAALVARLGRVADARLPPLIRAHVRLVGDLLDAAEPPDLIAARHAKMTGLVGLRLLVPSNDAGTVAVGVDDVIQILHACQAADDEAAVGRELCARVAARLDAAAVAIYVAGENASVVAAHGKAIDPEIAARAIAARIVIDPHQHEMRIEAAAPIQYGGEVIGAIAARWALGTRGARARAAGVLATAAAAIAPVLAVLRARRALPPSADLIGVSSITHDLRDAIDRAASAPFPVLIEGESGSGKELVARALHRRSTRRDRAFSTLNCAALPDDLVESELFGHARGAFTGAVGERTGVFEEAHGGTLFLDEIGELSPRAQAKVLRVVQEGELRRVGENISRRVDVRLVAATNRDLRREVEAGRFRGDLLYRLDVIRIVVAPLRDHRDDIPLLVEHYWREATSRIGSRAVLSAATIAALARYDWPGNVRELQNVLASLAVRAARRGVVGPAALPPLFDAGPTRTSCRLDEARKVFEEQFVRAALARAGGRRVDAAAELGVTRQGFTKLISRLGIDVG